MVEKELYEAVEEDPEPKIKKKPGRPKGSTKERSYLKASQRDLPNFFGSGRLHECHALLPVVQNLAAMGCTAGEVGALLGSTTEQPEVLISRLRKRFPEFEKAWSNGQHLVNTQLVKRLYETAMGYVYQEVVVDEKVDPETGKMRAVSRKISTKYEKPDASALLFLICNRMKEEFKNVQKLEIDKKTTSFSATAELTTRQMDEIGGKLMEHLSKERKKVESITVDSRQLTAAIAKNDTVCQDNGQPADLPTNSTEGAVGEPGVPADPPRLSGEGSGGTDGIPGTLSVEATDILRYSRVDVQPQTTQGS